MANGTESLPEFTEMELEASGLEAGEIELEIEQEMEQEMEAYPVEYEAEAVMVEMEGAEGQEALPFAAVGAKLFGKVISKRVVATLLRYLRAVVKRLVRSAASRTKLQNACRKGPKAVCQLLTPAVCRVVPKPFRWLCARLLPRLCHRSFRWICKIAGLKSTEVEAVEFETI